MPPGTSHRVDRANRTCSGGETPYVYFCGLCITEEYGKHGQKHTPQKKDLLLQVLAVHPCNRLPIFVRSTDRIALYGTYTVVIGRAAHEGIIVSRTASGCTRAVLLRALMR